MNELRPFLPGAPLRSSEADQPNVGQRMPGRNLLRLSGVVIAQGRSSLELEIDGQRWTGRSAQPLPDAGGRGARVVIEAQRHDGGDAEATVRLVATGRGRLQAPIDLILQPKTGPDGALPAAGPGRAPPLDVTLRMTGEGRTWLPARLSLAPQWSERPESVAAALEGGTRTHPVPAHGPSARAAAAALTAPVGFRSSIAASVAGPSALSSGAGRSATEVVVEAEVSGSDVASRLLLRVGERLLQVQGPLQLPKGARVRLSMAATDAAELDQAPKASLRPMVAPREPSRPLLPDAHLAVRLLDLAGRLGRAASAGSMDEAPAPPEPARHQLVQIKDQAGSFRVAEGRFGIEPELVGLRLHLPETPQDDREHCPERPDRGERRPRRAIVAVDFERLGACQLDVLCHGRRFDLRIRSERPLPKSAQLEATAPFIAARDAAGLEGEIVFAPGGLVVFELPTSSEPGVEV